MDRKLMFKNSRIENELRAAMVVLMLDQPQPKLEAEYEQYLANGHLEAAYWVLHHLGKSEEQLPEFYQFMSSAAKMLGV